MLLACRLSLQTKESNDCFQLEASVFLTFCVVYRQILFVGSSPGYFFFIGRGVVRMLLLILRIKKATRLISVD